MAAMDHFSIQIVSITGGLPFQLVMDKEDTVDNLKKAISQKVKVRKDKICLLYLDKELVEGSLGESNLMEGSRVKFVPRTETGMIAPTPEKTAVIQALESLCETEVKVKVFLLSLEINMHLLILTGAGLPVRDLPTEHDDDGLARRFGSWRDGQVRVVVPLTVRAPVPTRSRNRWSLASAEHQYPVIIITEL